MPISETLLQRFKQLLTCIQKKHYASHKHPDTTLHQQKHHPDVLRCTTICHLQKPPELHLQAMLLWKDFVNPNSSWLSIDLINVVKENAENEVNSHHSTRTSCDTTCRWTLQCPSAHDLPIELLPHRLKLRMIPSLSWPSPCVWARKYETESGHVGVPQRLLSLRLLQPQHPLQSQIHLPHRQFHQSSLRKQTRAPFVRVDSNIDNECAASRAAMFSTQDAGTITCCVAMVTGEVSNAPIAVRGT